MMRLRAMEGFQPYWWFPLYQIQQLHLCAAQYPRAPLHVPPADAHLLRDDLTYAARRVRAIPRRRRASWDELDRLDVRGVDHRDRRGVLTAAVNRAGGTREAL